jgi:betaine-aldehyde dehydrogenase
MQTRRYTHFISNQETSAFSDKVIVRSSPATGRLVAEFADGSTEDAQTANNGECCCSATRLLVHEEIATAFERVLAEATAKLKLDLPCKDDTDVGPLINQDHLKKVMSFVDTGKREGSTLMVGGQRATKGDLEQGWFAEPTIFSGVKPEMSIFRQEIFGPVLSVSRFQSTEEAIALANDTEYGLAKALWTKNVDTALAVSQALRSGTVWVNTMIDGSPQLPFGGYKASGFGREMGNAGLEEFTQVKTVLFHSGKRIFSILKNVPGSDTDNSH